MTSDDAHDTRDQTMSDHPGADLPVGDYVNDPPYLEMRLRMLLTGTASPDGRTWGDALKALLAHLAREPVPIAGKDDHASALTETRVDEDDLLCRIQAEADIMDLDDDVVPLVMGSDTPIVNRLYGRAIHAAETHRDSLVHLTMDGRGGGTFAVDIELELEDQNVGPKQILTFFGAYDAASIEWSHADLSARGLPGEETSPAVDQVVRTTCRLGREHASTICDETIGEAISSSHGMIIGTVPSDVVVTGSHDLLVFAAGAILTTSADEGTSRTPCIVQGTIDDGMAKILRISATLDR
jgi:hypothetical protein